MSTSTIGAEAGEGEDVSRREALRTILLVGLAAMLVGAIFVAVSMALSTVIIIDTINTRGQLCI